MISKTVRKHYIDCL